MKQNRKALYISLMLLLSIAGFYNCTDQKRTSSDPRGTAYAGSESCQKCHAKVYQAYSNTAHRNTTRPATAATIKGSFIKGSNRFHYNDSVYIEMQRRDSGFYQTALKNGKEFEAHRLDIVFGGQHAQTYLYWEGNRTYELPLSYYTSAGRWGTSPGFSASHIDFGRFIGANCFECHSAYAKSRLNASTAGIVEEMDRSVILYGIDCERCHGPAMDHVTFHENNPEVKQARYMVSIALLERERKLDVCAVCHSGNKKLQQLSTFQFRPGDTLSNFFVLWQDQDRKGGFDVHGNQFQMLSQSPCFLQSKTLDCSSCHNPHTNAFQDVAVYSDKCMSCHGNMTHPEVNQQADLKILRQNCIDCHMPHQPSQAISFETDDHKGKSAYFLRTHKIGIYKER